VVRETEACSLRRRDGNSRGEIQNVRKDTSPVFLGSFRHLPARLAEDIVNRPLLTCENQKKILRPSGHPQSPEIIHVMPAAAPLPGEPTHQ
jgi:hypothetical protein